MCQVPLNDMPFTLFVMLLISLSSDLGVLVVDKSFKESSEAFACTACSESETQVYLILSYSMT